VLVGEEDLAEHGSRRASRFGADVATRRRAVKRADILVRDFAEPGVRFGGRLTEGRSRGNQAADSGGQKGVNDAHVRIPQE
jgi:hypothetical protein